MSVVDPIFGRTAVNAASSCGCTCTQTTPTAPSFWCQKNDRGMYPWKKVRYLLKRRFPSHLEL